MQLHFLMTVLIGLFCVTSTSQSSAQENNDRVILRLKHRYEINDVDGIGTLIQPLFQSVVEGDSKFDAAQKHVIALSAMKFYVRTGEHFRAIVPLLIGLQIQSKLEEATNNTLIAPMSDSLRVMQVPPLFFSDEDRVKFRDELHNAIEKGTIVESELVNFYRAAVPNQLMPHQQEMLTSILAAKKNPKPSDREILRLIDFFVINQAEHPTLTHESLATAIEALQRLDRNEEAERLQAVFDTHYPDSRRLKR